MVVLGPLGHNDIGSECHGPYAGMLDGYDYAAVDSTSYPPGSGIFQIRVRNPGGQMSYLFDPYNDINFTSYSIVNGAGSCP
jgi:hypothetical protein